MIRFALYLFGSPRLLLDGTECYIRRRKGVALLTYLAVTRLPHSRDALATLFWPEFDQSGARDNLRRTLSDLHQALERNCLEIDRTTVRLRVDTGISVDVWQFQSLLIACQQHSHAKEQVCSDCLVLLEQAADLYRDDFLAGFTLTDSPAFDDWQAYTSDQFRSAFATILERLVDDCADQGKYAGAIDYARRWVALDPLHEAAQRRLMELYARSNQRAAALRQYEECRQILADELAVSPAPETTALYEQIRDRASDLVEITSRASPVRHRPLHNLLTQTTSFIGREQEVAEIEELLLNTADVRLLTLVGPGGIGKTRLAQTVASRTLNSFIDGVYFVALAAVEQVEQIVTAIGRALDFNFYEKNSPREQLLALLAPKRLLLIMDNFEQLLSGATLLPEILGAAPSVTLLVTSRGRLNLQEEWVYDVQGLSFPTDEITEAIQKPISDFQRYDAIQLFVQRARQSDATFTPTASDMYDILRICRLVEGMPLGLELAATWVRVLSCAEIAQEIEQSLGFLTTAQRNLPARHQSLQAVFEHSWLLLSADEQQIFAGCSVFRGGFTRHAALAVINATLPFIAALVDKSLVRRTATGRFSVHEYARQFAQDKLTRSLDQSAQAIEDAHACYFLQWLKTQEANLFGNDPQQAVTLLQADLENVHTAWNWACQHMRLDLLAMSLEALARFYWLSGQIHMGEQIFGTALKQVAQLTLASTQRLTFDGHIAYHRAELLYLLSDYQNASEIAQSAFAVGKEHDDLALQARCQILLGQISYQQGQLESARDCFESGHALALQVDRIQVDEIQVENKRLLAHALDNLGNIRHVLKAQDYGLAYHQEACRLARELGDLWALAAYLSDLGWMYYDKQEWRSALDYFLQALTLQRQLNARYSMIETLLRIGQAHLFLEQYDLAQEHHLEAAQLTEALGLQDNSLPWLAIGITYLRKCDWDRALHWLEKARQPLAALGKFAMLAECMGSMGAVYAGRGEYDAACDHYQAALALYRQLNIRPAICKVYLLLGRAYYSLSQYESARQQLTQALTLARTVDCRVYLLEILQELAKVAFSEQDFATAQTYCDECLQLLNEYDDQQFFFWEREASLHVNMILAKLMAIRGENDRATQLIETLLAASESPVERATLYDTHWQLTDDSASRQQALTLYRQLYAQTPYFDYRQRIDRLAMPDYELSGATIRGR